MPPAIEVSDLRKTYPAGPGILPWRPRGRPVEALRGVDFTVSEGESVALLGPNGAGKSTLLKILCTVLVPDGGDVRVLGRGVDDAAADVRRSIGYVTSDERSLYWRLTARENVAFFAALSGEGRRSAVREADRVLRLVGLGERADRRVMNLSTGMRQRLGLARGLLGGPRLLLLDEPTRSLDPAATLRLEQELGRMRARLGLTVLFVTHDLEQARRLAGRALILRDGVIAGEARLDDPTRRIWRVRREAGGAGFAETGGLSVAAGGLAADFTGSAAALADWLAACRAAGVRIVDLQERTHALLEELRGGGP